MSVAIVRYMNAGALSSTLAAKKKAVARSAKKTGLTSEIGRQPVWLSYGVADFQVPERLLANITWQVLDGLEYLHSEMHVIHRDIKPSNLLLSTTGIVKITDFGVSGELEDDLEQTKKVTFVGTIHYMSPERVVGKPYAYNSDTWSLGLTLMECILLRYPYAREEEMGKQFSFWELMRRIDTQEPPSLPAATQHSDKLQDFLQQAGRMSASLGP
ncbi:MKK1 [Symbiodinium natans]|uniref:mitogen-activated protein kinase kinase n=1 Tax=Symbiodinium natans TaxID=878477 RepID=A0A812PJ78_9DINO|nr:MKK1 [Symbiodinium natans]